MSSKSKKTAEEIALEREIAEMQEKLKQLKADRRLTYDVLKSYGRQGNFANGLNDDSIRNAVKSIAVALASADIKTNLNREKYIDYRTTAPSKLSIEELQTAQIYVDMLSKAVVKCAEMKFKS